MSNFIKNIIFLIIGAGIVYICGVMPLGRRLKDCQEIPKTNITNNYEKIKNNNGLIEANSAINDTIQKKWWKFGKKD